jgi:hypothetical protein
MCNGRNWDVGDEGVGSWHSQTKHKTPLLAGFCLEPLGLGKSSIARVFELVALVNRLGRVP